MPDRRMQTTLLEPLSLLPSRKTSIRHAQQSYDATEFLQEFDRVQVLGDDEAGHFGCVNALAWDYSGGLLASGSDDTRICIWKLGQDAAAGEGPKLGMDLQTVIQTGHTQNIFSVKWAPYCSSTRLISCAGDRKVQVFDISRSAEASTVSAGGRSHSHFSTDQSLIRTFRCHRDRVKRISLEDSADVFLTCSEDGTVRQHDLREPHTCPRCPAPLADYSTAGISLYTLSSSSLRPELFVCAGTSPYAYLHDRRMLPRMEKQWGVTAKQGLTTQCVRRFGAEGAGDSIVACKMSESNGREVLVSFSGGPVALFDVDGEVHEVKKEQGRTEGKRRRSATSPLDAPVRKTEKLDDDFAERKISLLAGLYPTSITEEFPEETHSALNNLETLRPEVQEEAWYILLRVLAVLMEDGPESALDFMQHPAFEAGRMAEIKFDMKDLVDQHDPEAYLVLRSKLMQAVRLLADDEHQAPSSDQAGFSIDVDDTGELRVATFGSSDEDDEEYEMSLNESEDEDEEEELEPPVPISESRKRAQEAKKDLDAVPLVTPKQTYTGHRNIETVKDVNFGFFKDSKIMSGSDDGRLFIWNKLTGDIEQIFEGDSSVVNVMITHPRLPVLACSGIDNTIKIFAPTSNDEKVFSALSDREQIVEQNATRTRRNPGRFMVPPTRALMALLARRMQQEEGEEGVVNLRQEDIDELMAEGGVEECCIS